MSRQERGFSRVVILLGSGTVFLLLRYMKLYRELLNHRIAMVPFQQAWADFVDQRGRLRPEDELHRSKDVAVDELLVVVTIPKRLVPCAGDPVEMALDHPLACRMDHLEQLHRVYHGREP